MNQYIITEEVAEIIETALESDEHCKKCPYKGWGFNQSALSLLRECPYQSERDKVLELCDKEQKKLTFDSSFATDNAYNEGRLSIIKIIKAELRQAGEP